MQAAICPLLAALPGLTPRTCLTLRETDDSLHTKSMQHPYQTARIQAKVDSFDEEDFMLKIALLVEALHKPDAKRWYVELMPTTSNSLSEVLSMLGNGLSHEQEDKYFVQLLDYQTPVRGSMNNHDIFPRVAFVMKKHLNTHLLGKHGVGTPKESLLIEKGKEFITTYDFITHGQTLSNEGIPLLFMHDECQLFQLLFPTTLLRAEELHQRAVVFDLFLTGCIASTVVMELPGHRAAELPPCTSVDAHLNPNCLPNKPSKVTLELALNQTWTMLGRFGNKLGNLIFSQADNVKNVFNLEDTNLEYASTLKSNDVEIVAATSTETDSLQRGDWTVTEFFKPVGPNRKAENKWLKCQASTEKSMPGYTDMTDPELHGEVGAEEPHEAAHRREALQVHLAHLPLFFPHSLCNEGPLQDSHRFATRFSLGPWRLAKVRMVMAERKPISKTLAFLEGVCLLSWFFSHKTWTFVYMWHCMLKFNYNNGLLELTLKSEKSFLCDLCGFAGGTRHALTKHRRQHTVGTIFPKQNAKANYNQEGEKWKAKELAAPSTRHCILSSKKIKLGKSNCAENIRKHILHTGKHEGVKMYNCPRCDYGTNIPVEFRNHLKELHPDIENPDLAYLHAAFEEQGCTSSLQHDCIINKGQNCDPISCTISYFEKKLSKHTITWYNLSGNYNSDESKERTCNRFNELAGHLNPAVSDQLYETENAANAKLNKTKLDFLNIMSEIVISEEKGGERDKMVSVDTYDNLSRDCSPAFLIIGYMDTELLSAHERIVSKSYECRLKGQGATFVETTSPFTAAALGEVSPVKEKAFQGSRRQPQSPEEVQQFIIIQGYDGDFAIDASVEETAAATLQTLAMAGQMARVVHITEDGQVIATNQNGSHVSGVVPEQILTEQLADGATQVVVVEGAGADMEEAVQIDAVPDSSSTVLQQIMRQEVLDASEATVHPPESSSALDALLCAVTELGEAENKSELLDRCRSGQKDFLQMPNPEVPSIPSDAEGEEIQMFHEVQETQEDTKPMEVVTRVMHPSAIIASQERAQAAFKNMVQGVLQFAVCDTAAADQLMKEGVTQVIVNEEGTVHMVSGEGSQIIMQEAGSHTLSVQSEHMDLVESDGQISQIIVSEELAQAMAQGSDGDFSEGATHYIVTELPPDMQDEPGVYSHAVIETAGSQDILQAGTAIKAEAVAPDRAREQLTSMVIYTEGGSQPYGAKVCFRVHGKRRSVIKKFDEEVGEKINIQNQEWMVAPWPEKQKGDCREWLQQRQCQLPGCRSCLPGAGGWQEPSQSHHQSSQTLFASSLCTLVPLMRLIAKPWPTAPALAFTAMEFTTAASACTKAASEDPWCGGVFVMRTPTSSSWGAAAKHGKIPIPNWEKIIFHGCNTINQDREIGSGE
ncbi:hypothetical protein DV515_00000105 [Chloebia gouldiae]|uniref:C2H2-type domain-containing protein n=1 Tax=Chloebia gouldiae TaxID=44316 RepID=A0A3L8T2W3_CHLGU|nr:hypothetical protein DV515_00000105 [Chloebia gouldiae]